MCCKTNRFLNPDEEKRGGWSSSEDCSVRKSLVVSSIQFPLTKLYYLSNRLGSRRFAKCSLYMSPGKLPTTPR